MTIQREEALNLITTNIRVKLRSSISEAVEDYHNLDANLKLTLSATTRANFINDRMCFHTRNKMSGMDGISFLKRRGRWHLVIIGEKGILEVKFKKLDYNRRPSNIPTLEAQQFLDQVQLEFPNMLHPITNLVAGYQLNATRTGIKGIFVVCPYHSNNEWEIEILITAVAPVTAFPVHAMSSVEESESPPKKVVPKATTVRKRIV